MIDIETMGVGHKAAISAICAMKFDMEDGAYDHTVIPVKLGSCVAAGLTIDASAAMFWMEQSDEAKRVLLWSQEEGIDIRSALMRLSAFINEYSPDYIWAKSPQFDLVILTSAYNACGFNRPWKYNQERDVRTAIDIGGSYRGGISVPKRDGFVAHNPVEDCLYQIDQVMEAFNRPSVARKKTKIM